MAEAVVNLDSVSVRAPGTTANLGCGYDVLGMALNIWLNLTVTKADKFGLTMTGAGADEVEKDESNFIVKSCKLAFEHSGKTMPPLHFTVRNDIPFGAGVGSSSAAAVAGYMAGMALCGMTLPSTTDEELLTRIVALEGHPDNAAAAIYGGVQIGYKSSGAYKTARVTFPSTLYAVVFTPDKKMKINTHAMRDLIPKEVAMEDAVHNMARTSLMILAMNGNRLDLLKDCLEERFHQEPRWKHFPHGKPCVAAAMETGACYAFLSGAGPSICAFVEGKSGDYLCQLPNEQVAGRVAEAMVEAAAKAGVPGVAVITTPSNSGAHFVGRVPLASNPRVVVTQT